MARCTVHRRSQERLATREMPFGLCMVLPGPPEKGPSGPMLLPTPAHGEVPPEGFDRLLVPPEVVEGDPPCKPGFGVLRVYLQGAVKGLDRLVHPEKPGQGNPLAVPGPPLVRPGGRRSS